MYVRDCFTAVLPCDAPEVPFQALQVLLQEPCSADQAELILSTCRYWELLNSADLQTNNVTTMHPHEHCTNDNTHQGPKLIPQATVTNFICFIRAIEWCELEGCVHAILKWLRSCFVMLSRRRFLWRGSLCFLCQAQTYSACNLLSMQSTQHAR